MEKIKFMLDTQESAEFYVLEQTKIGGTDYILVTDMGDGYPGWGRGGADFERNFRTGPEGKRL